MTEKLGGDMSSYTNQILELVVKRPGIRDVEIADQIGCDAEVVQPAIQAEIDSWKVLVSEITAPNGRSAKAFFPGPGMRSDKEKQEVIAMPDEPVEVPAFLLKPAREELVVAEVAKTKRLISELNDCLVNIANIGVNADFETFYIQAVGQVRQMQIMNVRFIEEREL